jgi:hypothetical protein
MDMIGLRAFGQSIASGIKKLQEQPHAASPQGIQFSQPMPQSHPGAKNNDMPVNHFKQPAIGSRLNLMA